MYELPLWSRIWGSLFLWARLRLFDIHFCLIQTTLHSRITINPFAQGGAYLRPVSRTSLTAHKVGWLGYVMVRFMCRILGDARAEKAERQVRLRRGWVTWYFLTAEVGYTRSRFLA